MPTRYIMCGRPINCRYCEHAYYGLLHMVKEAQTRGFNIVDLAGSDCVGTKIYQAIADYEPLFFFGLGHGNICVYTDDQEQPTFTCPNSSPGKTEILANRIVYLWSCLTGYDCRGHPESTCETICEGTGLMGCCHWDGDSCNSLGDSIIEAGGLAYAGFNISWTWMSVGPPAGDPYNDKYAYGFWESGNELILALLQLKTLNGAGEQSIAKYNEWIYYWKNEGSDDPHALDAIKWLVHDRDGLRLKGELNAVLIPPVDCTQFETKEECFEYGCYWYNGACHSTPPVDDSKDFTINIKKIAGYIYAGGRTTQTVRKYLKSDLSDIGETDSYGGTIYAIAIDDTHIYIGGSATETVRKYRKSDLKYTDIETDSYGSTIQAIAIDDTYIYVGGGYPIYTVRKYLKSDLSDIGETVSYGGYIQAIAIDDTYIYVGGHTTNTVRKYLKSDLSYIGETAIYGDYIQTVAIDDTYIYVGGGSPTYTVRKYLKSDLSYIGETSFYGVFINAIAIDDTYIYVGGFRPVYPYYAVNKYLKSNLSYVGKTVNYGGDIEAIAIDDFYIYVGGRTTNTVRKYLKYNLSYVDETVNYGGDIFAIGESLE